MAIRRLLDAVRPDVVHYHNLSLIGGPGLLEISAPGAVKLMTTHAEDYRPLTYAVWYEFVLQGDRQLCERLEQVVASGIRLGSAETEELHARYLVARRQQVVNQAHATILQALETMSSAIGDAHQNTGRFAGQLRDFLAAGAQQPLEPQVFNQSVMLISQQARQSSEELARVQARLEESEAQVLPPAVAWCPGSESNRYGP